MSWIPGRQDCGYFKRKIFSFNWCDCWLVKFPEGSCIKPHKDPTKGKRHWRFNLILRPAESGGGFWCNGPVPVNLSRFKVFRSDLYEHCVSPIEKGERLVLSFGVAL